MTFQELVEKLIEKTENDTYKWEYQKENQYRLVVPDGSVSIEKVFNPIHASYCYEVRLYDKDSCFARYDSQKGNEAQFVSLFKAVVSNRSRAIEKKIDAVFGGI